jgi:7-cyano-7-deazaguanine synthase
MARTEIIPPGKGRECVLLLSGGLDSTTLLAALARRRWAVNALTFSYGQKHRLEVKAAKKNAARFGCRRHILLDLPLGRVARSALTTHSIKMPRGGAGEDIPATYVPARNMVFLSLAVSWAESLGARHVFIAVSSVDFSGYPDCRRPFIRAFEKAARTGTKIGVRGGGIRIHAPFIRLSKKRIIRLGRGVGVDYARTRTCYDPDARGRACGICDACLLRLRGFEEAGATDPAAYRKDVKA